MRSEAFAGFAQPADWTPPDPSWRTLCEVLDSRAARASDAVAFKFLARDGRHEAMSFGELRAGARRIAVALRSRMEPGEGAVLAHAPSLEFICAFFGCLYADIRPIPVALSLLPDGLQRIAVICGVSGARALLANGAHLDRLRRALTGAEPALDTLAWIATDGLEPGGEDRFSPSAVASETAFLQFSSGSTGDPKGIAISHRNVLHNLALLNTAYGSGACDVGVNWLPHHHDMGLVAGLLHSIYAGIPTVLLSPLSFLVRPLEWLSAISAYRGTLCAAPNFAYEHCARQVSAQEREGLDLSCWTVAVCGSEPIRAETLDRFSAAFVACGFDRRAFCPSYGLAEATLMVSGGRRGLPPTVVDLDASALEQNRVEPPQPPRPIRSVVGCGRPQAQVIIVDPESGALRPAGEVGEILVAGPSVSQGYHNRPQASAAVFAAKVAGVPDQAFLRTGDLGFLREDELFVVGRLKDLIIVRGRNLHPQDLEATARACDPRLHLVSGAAFAIDADAEEAVAMVQEVDDPGCSPRAADAIVEAIRDAVRSAHQVELAAVVLVRPGQVPKTTSGKVQRASCRTLYAAGTLRILAAWPASRA